MTMWFQVRAMLAMQPSEELVRMKVVCKGNYILDSLGGKSD